MTKKPRASDSDTHWDDGTRKSTGNAFTSHGYKRGEPAKPHPLTRRPSHGNFGVPNGTIPGIASKKSRGSLK